jgi:hypothetical protein
VPDADLPVMSVTYDPGPPATMEIRSDGTDLPMAGDLITVDGACCTTAHRVREVIDHGHGRYTLRLGAA